MRLFVAAYPPPDVRDDLARLVGNLGVGRPRERGHSVRLAPAENWHITLAFLGDVPEPKLDEVRSALDRAVEGWRTGSAGVPELRIAGGGTFGRRRFTTLWAGLTGDVDALGEIADGVRGELRSARLPYDEKRFRPHVTIARPGDRITADELAADLAALGEYEGPRWPVGDIRLMQSHLGPRPTYDVMHSVPLAA